MEDKAFDPSFLGLRSRKPSSILLWNLMIDSRDSHRLPQLCIEKVLTLFPNIVISKKYEDHSTLRQFIADFVDATQSMSLKIKSSARNMHL